MDTRKHTIFNIATGHLVNALLPVGNSILLGGLGDGKLCKLDCVDAIQAAVESGAPLSTLPAPVELPVTSSGEKQVCVDSSA